MSVWRLKGSDRRSNDAYNLQVVVEFSDCEFENFLVEPAKERRENPTPQDVTTRPYDQAVDERPRAEQLELGDSYDVRQ